LPFRTARYDPHLHRKTETANRRGMMTDAG